MPRAVQPGGGGGKMRVRYTARRKRGLVATSKRMIAEGMTLRAAAEELPVVFWLCSRFVLRFASYFLFHVNKVLRCWYLHAHRSNDGILGIAGKLLIRRDNL